VQAGDLLIILASGRDPSAYNHPQNGTEAPGAGIAPSAAPAMTADDRVAQLLESSMQETLKSKRSLGKATSIVSDVVDNSGLWTLSRDKTTAGK
jgi:hypothetical protein